MQVQMHSLVQVCRFLSIKKVNTSGYHHQSDGLVEKFNSTLSAMLSKVAEAGKDWDRHLPFVPFAYRNSIEDSTKESPLLLTLWERCKATVSISSKSATISVCS